MVSFGHREAPHQVKETLNFPIDKEQLDRAVKVK